MSDRFDGQLALAGGLFVRGVLKASGSVNTCILLTFLSLIQGRGVTLLAYDSEVEGLLEHKEGAHQMTEVTVRPHVTVASAAELATARQAMDKVEPRWFMSQSVKARVTVEAQFAVGRPPRLKSESSSSNLFELAGANPRPTPGRA